MTGTRHGTSEPTGNGAAGNRQRWLEVGFLALLALFWATYVTPIVLSERRHGGDVFRDAACAVNATHGQFLADPAYRGQSLWYPPLSPFIIAGISALFGSSPLDCYRWSQLLFNWMIPAGMYLLVRLGWGRRAAAGATIALLLAMPWWQSEVVQGQPSTQAVVWGWAAILLYAKQHRAGSLTWTVVCGLFLGIAFWHHPLIPGVLVCVFLMQAAWARRCELRAPGEERARSGAATRNLLIVGVAIIVAGPVLYLVLHGPVLNTTPREFIAPELRTVEFSLMRAHPWIWAMGIVGLVASLRRASFGARLLVSTLALCTVGQVIAYPRILGVSWAASLPIIVPHELQWTFQLGWAICVGVGIDHMLRAAANRSGLLRDSSAAGGLATLLALALTGMGGIADVKPNLRRFVHTYARNFPQATTFIRERTDINDVFVCEPIWAFAWLNPTTGRKVWLTEPGHSNPRVDWDRRKQVLDELAQAPTPRAFWLLAREHEIDYCIPSPGWMPRIIADPALRAEAVPTYLEPVFDPGPDEPAILRVRDKPIAAHQASQRKWFTAAVIPLSGTLKP